MSRLVLIAVILAGCSPHVYRTEVRRCDPSTTEKRASFILDCIERANPKSDEEPEDWLYYCQRFATDLYCPLVPAFRVASKKSRDCVDAAEPHEIAACEGRFANRPPVAPGVIEDGEVRP
jgi:hypothetical protein